MSDRVVVSAPSRLHFGLMALAPRDQRRGFGGVGWMIDAPRLRLAIAATDRFGVRGLYRERLLTVVERCCQAWGIEIPPIELKVEQSVPRHAGLGFGTQLALSAARGLARFLERDDPTPQELAVWTGRGQRSAVGTYGNVLGGVVHDAGKQTGEMLGQLGEWSVAPTQWRVLLARSQTSKGASGLLEERAFAKLPDFDASTTEALSAIATGRILPACQREDFDEFAQAVHEYGQLAGRCFAPWQGGVYASPEIADVARRLTLAGAVGVGQSSWGPTVFGMAPTAETAGKVASRFKRQPNEELRIVGPDNRGLRFET